MGRYDAAHMALLQIAASAEPGLPCGSQSSPYSNIAAQQCRLCSTHDWKKEPGRQKRKDAGPTRMFICMKKRKKGRKKRNAADT